MVTWQLLLLAATLLGGLIGWWADRTPASAIGGLFVGAFVSFLVGGVIILILSEGEGSLSDENIASGQCVQYETVQFIVSIERNSQLYGSFVLGSGSIRSNMYYFAYVDTPDGWFLDKYRQNKTYIIEDEGDPRVVNVNYKCYKPIFSWLVDKEWEQTHYNRKHTIHVPPYSILREFNL